MSIESLIEAIDDGDLDTVRKLIGTSPQLIEARDEAGLSLVLHALYHRQEEVADLLAERREDELDFLEAVALGRGEEVEQKLAADPGLVGGWSEDGFTPLHYAAFFGRREIVRLLVEEGADIEAEARNPTRVRPLHSAAACADPEICRILLRAGADPDCRQAGGYTPLMSAAHQGDRVLLELLLEAGAGPAVLSEDGRSAADFARDGNQERVAERLDAAASRQERLDGGGLT